MRQGFKTTKETVKTPFRATGQAWTRAREALDVANEKADQWVGKKWESIRGRVRAGAKKTVEGLGQALEGARSAPGKIREGLDVANEKADQWVGKKWEETGERVKEPFKKKGEEIKQEAKKLKQATKGTWESIRDQFRKGAGKPIIENLEKDTVQEPPKSPKEMFSPEDERKKIMQMPGGKEGAEAKKQAFEKFKARLAEQRKDLAELQVDLEKKIEANPDIKPEELEKFVKESSEQNGFSPNQQKVIQDSLEKYYQERAKVLTLRNKYENTVEGNRQLIAELTGVELSPDEMAVTKISTGPMNFVIETDNETTNKLYEKLGGQVSGNYYTGGFANSGRAVNMTVLNNEMEPGVQQNIKTHEDQHLKNYLFESNFEDLNEKVFQKRLSLQQIPGGQEGNSEITLRRAQERNLAKVKDEMLATIYTRGTDMDAEELFLRGDKSPYDYFGKTRSEPIYQDNMEIATDIEAEYRGVVSNAADALQRLKKSGRYTDEKTIALLIDKPLRDWPKTVQRLLEQK